MSKKFNYSYSTPTDAERKEIERIKNQYTVKSDNKEISTLRKLDGKVRNIPTYVAIMLGTVGTLIFGTGLTLILELGMFIWGSIISFIGCFPIALAYPIHNKIYNKLKNKYSEQIIELSNKLLEEKKEKDV